MRKGSKVVAKVRKLRTSNRTNNPKNSRGAVAGILNNGNGQMTTAATGKAKKVGSKAKRVPNKTGVAYRPLQLGNAPLSQRGD